MANTPAKGGFNITDGIVAMGSGSASGSIIQTVNNKVAWFGSNTWAAPLFASIALVGADYFTNGKHPAIIFGALGGVGYKGTEAVQNMMQGYSQVNGGATKKMDQLLADIKKFRANENKAIDPKQVPRPGVQAQFKPAMNNMAQPAYQSRPDIPGQDEGMPYDYGMCAY